LDPRVYDIFYSPALELNPELLTLTPGTPRISQTLFFYMTNVVQSFLKGWNEFISHSYISYYFSSHL